MAFAAIIIIAGATLYFASSIVGNHSQTTLSSSGTSTTTSTSLTLSSTTPSTNFTGPGHMLIGDFLPHVPIISPFLSLSYQLYFSALGTVPSVLAVSLTSSAPINFTLSPVQINEPGIGPYVNTTVTMRPSPKLAPGTYPVTVQATGSGATYTETLLVQVLGYVVVTSGFTYKPTQYTVPVNTTVTWLRLNPGGNNGIIKGDIGIMNFDIPSLNYSSRGLLQFETATYTFTKPGTYPFHCDFHPTYMNGVITVAP